MYSVISCFVKNFTGSVYCIVWEGQSQRIQRVRRQKRVSRFTGRYSRDLDHETKTCGASLLEKAQEATGSTHLGLAERTLHVPLTACAGLEWMHFSSHRAPRKGETPGPGPTASCKPLREWEESLLFPITSLPSARHALNVNQAFHFSICIF